MSVDIRLDFLLCSLVPDWKWVARPHFIVEEDWSQENVQAFISNMLFFAIFCYFGLGDKYNGQENMSVIEGLSHFISYGGVSGYKARRGDLDLPGVRKMLKERFY